MEQHGPWATATAVIRSRHRAAGRQQVQEQPGQTCRPGKVVGHVRDASRSVRDSAYSASPPTQGHHPYLSARTSTGLVWQQWLPLSCATSSCAAETILWRPPQVRPASLPARCVRPLQASSWRPSCGRDRIARAAALCVSVRRPANWSPANQLTPCWQTQIPRSIHGTVASVHNIS